MKTVLFIISFVCLLSVSSYAQESMQAQVILKANVVDSTFVFGKWNAKEGTELHLTYLGSVTTFEGTILKFMNRAFIFGLSHRMSTRLYVFSAENRFLGYYILGGKYDMPDRLENGMLIFEPNNGCAAIRSIDMRMGILPLFFKECKDGRGNVYYFEKDIEE